MKLKKTHKKQWIDYKKTKFLNSLYLSDVCFTSFTLLCSSLKWICEINNAVKNIQFVSLIRVYFFFIRIDKEVKINVLDDRSLLNVRVTYICNWLIIWFNDELQKHESLSTKGIICTYNLSAIDALAVLWYFAILQLGRYFITKRITKKCLY